MSDPSSRDLYVRLRTALAAHRPLPDEVRAWLLQALRAHERGAELTAALGLAVGPGEAWRSPARQARRARLERLLLTAAAAIGGSDSAAASRIARVLAEHRFEGVPARSIEALLRLAREFEPEELPRSRSAVLRILTGDSRAQRDGAVARLEPWGGPRR